MTAKDFFEELMQRPLELIQQNFQDQHESLNVLKDVKFFMEGKTLVIEAPETYSKPLIREIARQIRQRAKFVNFVIEAR